MVCDVIDAATCVLASQTAVRTVLVALYLRDPSLSGAASAAATHLFGFLSPSAASPSVVVPVDMISTIVGCGRKGASVPFVYCKRLFTALSAAVIGTGPQSATAATGNVLLDVDGARSASARGLACVLNREAKGALVDDFVSALLHDTLVPIIRDETANNQLRIQGSYVPLHHLDAHACCW
jgi:hypothetical protein